MKKLFLNNNFIIALIVLNVIVIFVGGFGVFQNLINFLDISITILFILELLIKINHQKKDFFNEYWNVFDFILVLFSIPSLLVVLLQLNFHDLSFLLAFRVLRIFKTFRFIRFIPNINHLIQGTIRALKSSLLVLFGFIIFIFIFGLLSFYMFNQASPEYFSNPLQSLYSIFKISTLEGWAEIPKSVTKNYSEIKTFFTNIYFVIIVLSGGILGISLVNSIFVDAMLSDNNDGVEKKIKNLEAKIDILLNSQK